MRTRHISANLFAKGRFAELSAHAGRVEVEADQLRAEVARLRDANRDLVHAGELLLEGYVGMGGHPNNNGPHFMRKAIDAARAALAGKGEA